MVLDENYHVVGHSDFSNIGKDFSNRPFTAELSSQKKNVGQYNASNDGKRLQSDLWEIRYNNWTYISMIKISELNKQSYSIGWFTLLISAVILLGALIFSFIASQRLYAPINRITSTLSNSLSGINQSEKKVDEFRMIESHIQHVLEQNDELESNSKDKLFN